MNILAAFSDFVYPRQCELCGAAVDRPGRHVCAACLMRLPFVGPVGCCRLCGRSATGASQDYVCEDCRGRNRPCFDAAASALRFEGAARQMLLDYKFRRGLWLREDLVDYLEAAVRMRFRPEEVDVVVPLPLSAWHRYDRGYNQSEEFARSLARRLDRRLVASALVRCGNPRRQSTLSEDERRENARDSVAVRRPADVRGRTVLVVDDIMTTGATLSECARVLKEAGAFRVWCATVARSVRS